VDDYPKGNEPMKYELSIDASYLDDDRWNAAAGIREFLQNGRDAAIEQNAPLTVIHRDDRLIIENEGATLTRDALLLGRSTKRERQDVLAGKWGEGMKLGALALVRAGHPVLIRNGSEVWTPSIEASEKFAGCNVLVFTVASGRQDRNRVRVEIGGVDAEVWQVLKEHYLFLRKSVGDVVETKTGSLLLGEKQKGAVYVKGILVQRHHELEYGYNLKTAELDRDRRMVESWDLKMRVRDVWFNALSTRPDLIDNFTKMLDAGATDVEGVDDWNVSGLSAEVRAAVAALFQKRHGESAIPVGTLADSKDIEHLGKKGIIVKKPLQVILESIVGTFADVKKKLADEVVKVYGWSEIEHEERVNLENAIGLIRDVPVKIGLDVVEVADFRSPTLLGQYVFKDNFETITIARKILTNRAETLATLVHEVAHRDGIDGDKGHVERIEAIWSSIVDKLR
jgi:hypothetical protein